MKLMDIYYGAINPIDDETKLNKILEAYSNPNGMYVGIATSSSRKYVRGDSFYGYMNANHNLKDKDIFYSKITNLWLNSIKNMSREYFIERIGTRDFFDLRHKYLIKCREVTSKEEADELLEGKNLNKDLRYTLNFYSWTCDQNFWEHVKAGNIHLDKNRFKKCEHRLYINPDSEDLFEFMNYFVDKCEERNLAYYFKFCKEFSRDDNFVIYSSTDELTKYIEVLKEIKKEHPDLVSRFKEPPLLSGEIDGFIGYGSEPVLLNREKTEYSFNSVREKRVLSPAINKVTREWLYENKDKKIKLKRGELAIKNLVSYMAVNDIVDTLKFFIKGKDNNKAFMENGITINELDNNKFRNEIFKIIDPKMNDIIEKYCYGKTKDIKTITIPLNNDKHFNFSGYQFDRVISDLPRRIAKYDKEYVQNLKTQIYKNADEYKINVNKFFLDNYALREFQLTDYNNLREVNKDNLNWEKEKHEEIDRIFNVEKYGNLKKDKQSDLDKMFSSDKNNDLNNNKKQNLN